MRPANQLRRARPAMNAAKTVLVAYAVTPNKRPNILSHRTRYTRA